MLNLKKIFEKIADAGQKILENKNLKRPAKKDLIHLCDELLSREMKTFPNYQYTLYPLLENRFDVLCCSCLDLRL